MKPKICKWCGSTIPKGATHRRLFCSLTCNRDFFRKRKRLKYHRVKDGNASEAKPLGYPGYLIDWLLDGCLAETKRKWLARWEGGSGKGEAGCEK